MSKQMFVVAPLLGLALLACNPAAKPMYPERRGGRGEACVITNDCKEPLLCIGQRCLDEQLSFKPTSKVCVTAQCIETSDCCPPLSKPQQTTCATLKKQCDQSARSDLGLYQCSQYQSQCVCEKTCTDHACVAKTNSHCATSLDCAGGTCLNGHCGECSKDTDCGKDYICESNQCQLGCLHDEACGSLSSCKAGRCEARGCESNRECALALELRDAVCQKGVCGMPCKNDAECGRPNGELNTCSDGICKFVGCDTDAECAAFSVYSYPSYPSSSTRPYHLCLSQSEANKVR
jgi:hypothetical protein